MASKTLPLGDDLSKILEDLEAQRAKKEKEREAITGALEAIKNKRLRIEAAKKLLPGYLEYLKLVEGIGSASSEQPKSKIKRRRGAPSGRATKRARGKQATPATKAGSAESKSSAGERTQDEESVAGDGMCASDRAAAAAAKAAAAAAAKEASLDWRQCPVIERDPLAEARAAAMAAAAGPPSPSPTTSTTASTTDSSPKFGMTGAVSPFSDVAGL